MFTSLAMALSLLSVPWVDDPATNKPALPFVHPLFTDHGIIQRDVTVPVWGWTEPGGRIKVSLAGQTVETTADGSGKWLARFGPFPAGGSHTLSVTGPGKSVEVTDLMGRRRLDLLGAVEHGVAGQAVQ